MENRQEQPSEVGAEEGSVIVDGPDGVAVTLSPDAALETADRLFEAGVAAAGQEAIARRQAERRGRGEPPDI